MTKLISKSAKMAGIDRILLFPAQMTCIDNKTRDMRPNCVILADLEINLPQNLSFNAALHTLIEL